MFDVMLRRQRQNAHTANRGLMICDRRVVPEREIQEWTREWQKAVATIGQLRNMADVPLFADSRVSRFIQPANLVSDALYRHYDAGRKRTKRKTASRNIAEVSYFRRDAVQQLYANQIASAVSGELE